MSNQNNAWSYSNEITMLGQMRRPHADKRIHGRDPHNKLAVLKKPRSTVLVLNQQDYIYFASIMLGKNQILSSEHLKVQARLWRFISDYKMEKVFRKSSNQNNEQTYTVILSHKTLN